MPVEGPGLPLVSLLHPEHVRANKRLGKPGLEVVPVVQVGQRCVLREAFLVPVDEPGFQQESDEFQIEVAQHGLDLGQSEAMLLNVKQQMATLAGGVRIYE